MVLPSHCPWVNNCVAVNNHRFFIFYIITMHLGILAFIRLLLAYLSNLPTSTEFNKNECAILSEELCTILHKDPFTIILALWSSLQLIWVTMLILVQLLQIGRGLTTYESMKGYSSSGTDPITSFVTTGSASLEGSAVASGTADSGPDTVQVSSNVATAQNQPQSKKNAHHQSCWSQWQRLLGLDTFIATAFGGTRGLRAHQNGLANPASVPRNPFTRGVLTNCKDFWCDPAPYFKMRENGMALLGGERVDYTSIYNVRPGGGRMRVRQGGDDGGAYEAVGTGEEDV
jgi:palmitoyltransferase ZDHHC13/17